MALASTSVDWWEWDEYPYDGDIKEKVKDKNGREIDEPYVWLSMCISICPDCDYSEWISIEESNYEIQNTCNHTVTHSNWYMMEREGEPKKIFTDDMYQGRRGE
jgi:hypothetical protein